MNKSNNNDTVPKRFERNVGNRLVGGARPARNNYRFGKRQVTKTKKGGSK